MRTIIVEGMDLVGKTAVIESLCSKYDVPSAYRPDYYMYDIEFKSRDKAFMFGYCQSDIFKFLKTYNMKLPDNIIYDRSVLSSFVYSRLYEDQSHIVGSRVVLTTLSNLVSCLDEDESVDIVHVKHSSRESAKRIFDYCQNDGSHTEKYDKFKNFDDYEETLRHAEKMYNYIYSFTSCMPRVNVYVCYTESNNEGSRVTTSPLELLEIHDVEAEPELYKE